MESELRAALYTALATFAADEGLRVAYPNVAFDPANDALYLRAAVLPVPPQQLSVCGTGARYSWLLQVAVYAQDGVGEIKPLGVIDRFRAAFPASHRFAVSGHDFVVTAPATVPPPVSTSGWFFIPAQLRIQTIQ